MGDESWPKTMGRAQDERGNRRPFKHSVIGFASPVLSPAFLLPQPTHITNKSPVWKHSILKQVIGLRYKDTECVQLLVLLPVLYPSERTRVLTDCPSDDCRRLRRLARRNSWVCCRRCTVHTRVDRRRGGSHPGRGCGGCAPGRCAGLLRLGDAARLLVDVEHLLRRRRVERLHLLPEWRRKRASVVLDPQMVLATLSTRWDRQHTYIAGGLGDALLLVHSLGLLRCTGQRLLHLARNSLLWAEGLCTCRRTGTLD